MPPAHRIPSTEGEEIAAFLAASDVASGARILDAPCGLGRRAHALAEHGYRVTAVDANAVAIDALKQQVPQGLADHLIYRSAPRETMPELASSESFPVILCLDHALGRGPREEDVALLERLRAHLSDGGVLLVDLLHRDFFAARPRPFAYHVIGEVEQHEFRSFDPVSGFLDLTWRFYARDGKDLRFRGASTVHMRLLAPHEAQELLAAAGWRVEAAYGGWNREAVSADCRKLLLVARPAARR